MRSPALLCLALAAPALLLPGRAHAIHLPFEGSGASSPEAGPILIELPPPPAADAKNPGQKRKLTPAKMFPHQEIRDEAIGKAFETLERVRSLQRQNAAALKNGVLPGGYQAAAGSLRSCADDLAAEVDNLADQQRKISDYSYNLRPGATNEEARGFRLANHEGATRVTGFKADDPLVREQADQYDQLGRAANEIEFEARRYVRRAAELDAYARKVAASESKEGATEEEPVGKEVKTMVMARFSSDRLQAPALPAPESAPALAGPAAEGLPAENGPAAEWGAGKGMKATGSANPYHGSASGRSLREELRARLREHYGHEPSEAELDQGEQASLAAESGAVAGHGASFSAPPTDDPVDPFSKGLGTPAISLAGSETDASVKAMFRQLAPQEAAPPGRAPASLQGADVGAEEGPTLFERARATHRRCEQRGCVNWRVAVSRGGA